MFSSGTPLAFITLIAIHAEPPVASIGSRIKTAIQNKLILAQRRHVRRREGKCGIHILLDSIFTGNFEYMSVGRLVSSSRWIRILPKLRGPLCGDKFQRRTTKLESDLRVATSHGILQARAGPEYAHAADAVALSHALVHGASSTDDVFLVGWQEIENCDSAVRECSLFYCPYGKYTPAIIS